jgi:hypothetical protein
MVSDMIVYAINRIGHVDRWQVIEVVVFEVEPRLHMGVNKSMLIRKKNTPRIHWFDSFSI